MISYETRFSDELMHHGIDGQKWGKKNGPPYPLSRQDHKQVISSSKTKAEKEKAAEEKRQAKEYRKAFKKRKKAEAFRIKYEKKLEKQKKKQEEEEKRKQEEAAKAEEAKKKRAKEFSKSKSAEDASKLSSEELQARINRLKLEEEYKNKMNSARGKQKKEGVIRNVLKKSATTALSTAATAALTVVGKQILENLMDTNKGLKDSDIRDRRRRSLDRYI